MTQQDEQQGNLAGRVAADRVAAEWDGADVAPVVAFLASDEARMVSGASFAVTAGDSANVTA
ncbi:MAG TPA: hypothetical protein VG164_13720 [Trebonia sp.]|jgi:NAD(P)-dependent dehydrogenase (short-subunit alcohol dehydrogenase family)|nr:hypothetical protein [Trebonia sp.]